MDLRNLITKDPEILGGIPVFYGTRVPIEALFDHIKAGVTVDEFLEDFPTVSKEQVAATIKIANKLLTSEDLDKLIRLL